MYSEGSCAKRYKVDFWDSFDLSWSGLGPTFDDLAEAMARCDQMQAELEQGNKDCGEHYGVIDLVAGREIYCTARRGAPPDDGPAKPSGDSGAGGGPPSVS
jgi:hypothetical protein